MVVIVLMASCTTNGLKDPTVAESKNFSTSVTVNRSPNEVFDAINNVRGWWSEEIVGDTNKLDAEFDYHYEDIHRSKMKIVEFVPGKRVAWLVKENHFNFTKDATEWTGDKIVFDIEVIGDKTRVVFTQIGLVPESECYEICEKAWTHYVQQSLAALITEGRGQPNGKGKAQTEDEKRLSNQ